jgi:RimJ/RimL family protein N-acetyltransferase
MTIETAQLRLVPFSPQQILALIEGVAEFEKQIGLPATEGLRELFVSGDVSPAWLAQLRTATAADPWVHGFAVVDRESQSVVGSAGFKGPPDGEGMVEIGYGIANGYRGRGYATEAAAALINFARENSNVRVVRAHTLPTPNASTRVLEKCGFACLGQVLDPEDGPVWRWELPDSRLANQGESST